MSILTKLGFTIKEYQEFLLKQGKRKKKKKKEK